MAETARPSITRRAMVAGSAVAVPAAALAACLPDGGPPAGDASFEGLAALGRLRMTQEDIEAPADPVHAAIAAHAHAYAAYDAQVKAADEDDEAMERLCEAEWATADALAATVPATLGGVGAVLAYVRGLHERDDFPLLDDFRCYVFIASTETAVRRALDQVQRR